MHYSVRPATLVENTSSVKSRREVTEGLLGNKESISSNVFSVKPKTEHSERCSCRVKS